MRLIVLAASLALSACVVVAPPAEIDRPGLPLPAPEPVPSPQTAARNFSTVVRRMEPEIARTCAVELGPANCDFRIIVDTTPGAPPNAFQTRDETGRPIIAFTLALIAEARNEDELAFVMGHESAHHILAHIGRSQQTAALGGALSGALVAAMGGDPGSIQTAQQLGATVASRTYSKDYELEADQLGTVLAWRAGFDPILGAAFFTRIPDPGNRFLGTHPPNADRIAVVRETVALLERGY